MLRIRAITRKVEVFQTVMAAFFVAAIADADGNEPVEYQQYLTRK